MACKGSEQYQSEFTWNLMKYIRAYEHIKNTVPSLKDSCLTLHNLAMNVEYKPSQ